MVTILVIAILAGMLMLAMANAQETARIEKTRTTIAKLNNLIMERWESYKTRRVPVYIPPDEPYEDVNGNGIYNTGDPYTDLNGNLKWDYTLRQKARLRLDGLRALMRMEMPDRYEDISDDPKIMTPPKDAVCDMAVPSVTLAYRSRVGAAIPPMGENVEDTNERAECLYLIITVGLTDDVGAREQFHESEIGDTDKDGMPEFLDGWRRPIRFLRWAPGFISPLQPEEVMGELRAPDAFDPIKVYPTKSGELPVQDDPTFALYPLIYSAGGDGSFDISGGPDGGLHYAEKNNNPYLRPPAVVLRVGTPDDTDSAGGVNMPDGRNGSIDNITNQLMQAK